MKYPCFLNRASLLATIVILLFGFSRQGNLAAQTRETPPDTIRVATRIVPPFVMQRGAAYDGFSIDLWKAVSRELGVKTQFTTNGTVQDLLNSVREGKADLGISAISITSEREKILDFSQPMFDAGLQILVPDTTVGNNGPGFLALLFSSTMLQTLGIVALMVLIPAHLIWFFERNHAGGIIENKNYFPGIFKAFWWSAGTLGAQADEMPRSNWGRLIAVFWMFTGIAFVAYFTATVTASMTVQQLQGDIRGPDDLSGKRVATVSGSTSEKYLRERGVKVRGFAQFQDAADALKEKQVQAVVFDAPVVLYYAANAGKDKVHVVGPIFRRENYGIVFPAGSPWRRRVNYALLKLREDGTYETLYNKWFAENED